MIFCVECVIVAMNILMALCLMLVSPARQYAPCGQIAYLQCAMLSSSAWYIMCAKGIHKYNDIFTSHIYKRKMCSLLYFYGVGFIVVFCS